VGYTLVYNLVYMPPWWVSLVYNLVYMPPWVWEEVHHLGIYHLTPPWVHPSSHHCHDCTGVRCVQCGTWVGGEALGSNPKIIREYEAKRDLPASKV